MLLYSCYSIAYTSCLTKIPEISLIIYNIVEDCVLVNLQSRKQEQSRAYRHRHNSTLISEDTRGGNIFLTPNARALQRARRVSGNNSRCGIIVTCATRNYYRERDERSPTTKQLRTYASFTRCIRPTLGLHPGGTCSWPLAITRPSLPSCRDSR